jgi:hypothetical protein
MRTSWGICKLLGIEMRIDSSWIFIFGMINWDLTAHYSPSQYPVWPIPHQHSGILKDR